MIVSISLLALIQLLIIIYLIVDRRKRKETITTKSIKSTSLSLQSINNIKSSNSFTSGMFTISNSITNDIFQKYFQGDLILAFDLAKTALQIDSMTLSIDGRTDRFLECVSNAVLAVERLDPKKYAKRILDSKNV